MSDTIPDQIIKALEWSKDWSIWLVGLQTAIVGGIAIALGKPQESVISFRSILPLKIALYAFLASIATATWVLAGIPTILCRITASDKDVFLMPLFSWLPMPLWIATTCEHWFFIIGFIFLIFSVRCKIKCRN